MFWILKFEGVVILFFEYMHFISVKFAKSIYIPLRPTFCSDFGMKRFIDLTFPVEDMSGWKRPAFLEPWTALFELETTPIMTHDKEERSCVKLAFASHSGTHIDAPRHILREGKTIDQIPLEQFIGEAVVLDFSHKKSERAITSKDLEGTAIMPNDAVLFRTGWAEMWGTPEFYEGAPHLTLDAADYLLSKGVRAVGADFPCVDPMEELRLGQRPPIHEKLLGEGLILLEQLANLEQITKERVTVIALPLKIKNGDGCPARIVAIEE